MITRQIQLNSDQMILNIDNRIFFVFLFLKVQRIIIATQKLKKVLDAYNIFDGPK